MAVSDFIADRQKHGIYTWSFEDLKLNFGHLQARTLTNELSILVDKGLIVSPYKGFYSVVLPHYQLRGIVPPVFYIDQLMEYIGRPYYISLLSAAEMHGAAHQRPQKMQVFTTKPSLNVSSKNQYLKINYRRIIVPELIWKKNSEVDSVSYSSPELTAVDLVQYNHLCGGISNSATVLAELLEVTDFNRNFPKLLEMASLAALQRLGYIIEEILQDEAQANVIYEQLKKHGKDMRQTPLVSEGDSVAKTFNAKWKIIVNHEIEIDEI